MGALIRLLSSTGEETHSGLTVLLCEVLTAVYLSLFVHGLATHSSNELFRIVAHPLNAKLWAAVFGGGSRVPVVERPSPSGMSSGEMALSESGTSASCVSVQSRS